MVSYIAACEMHQRSEKNLMVTPKELFQHYPEYADLAVGCAAVGNDPFRRLDLMGALRLMDVIDTPPQDRMLL